jgi:hypothetical protein
MRLFSFPIPSPNWIAAKSENSQSNKMFLSKFIKYNFFFFEIFYFIERIP